MKLSEKFNELIKEIDQHLLDGKFKFKSCNEYTAKLIIDEINVEYWITNDPEDHFSIYSINGSNGRRHKGLFTNKETRLKGYNILKPHIDKYNKEVLIKQLEELKSRLQ